MQRASVWVSKAASRSFQHGDLVKEHRAFQAFEPLSPLLRLVSSLRTRFASAWQLGAADAGAPENADGGGGVQP